MRQSVNAVPVADPDFVPGKLQADALRDWERFVGGDSVITSGSPNVKSTDSDLLPYYDASAEPQTLFTFNSATGELSEYPVYAEPPEPEEDYTVSLSLDEREAAFQAAFSAMAIYNKARGRQEKPEVYDSIRLRAMRRGLTPHEADVHWQGIREATDKQAARSLTEMKKQFEIATGVVAMRNAGIPLDKDEYDRDFAAFKDKFSRVRERAKFLKQIGVTVTKR